ncbi:hypothetical protein [uncultured Paracoccus sp.]|uniref:hypothetical protein n=1 Tax=uncultured Paracoccus sp. TaxID=189685 RepID=UPI002620FE4E|nr:hypothetical protein [uncultured Paracoccus sp.]
MEDADHIALLSICLGAVAPEDLAGPEIANWPLQRRDEVSWVEIVQIFVVPVGIGVDEDVCEGGRSVTDISDSRQRSQDLPYLCVDPRHVELPARRIHRGLIAFIVNQEHLELP